MYYYTEERVLVIDPERIPVLSVKRICNNYQATKLVSKTEGIRPTWANNKVPILLGTKADLESWQEKAPDYTFINIPESAASFDLNTGSDPFIEFCHSQGVECGEFITGKKHYVTEEGCFLCEIANGFGASLETRIRYNEKITPISHMVLYESTDANGNPGNFIVKIELGHFAAPQKKQIMAMICSKNHYTSTANIPDEFHEEYQQVCRDVEYLFKKIYGEDTPVVFFEHGSAPDGGATHKRSIVHHHTHVICGVRMEKEDLERVGMRPIDDIREVRGKKYLSYQEGVDGQLWVADHPDTFIPRQYPRKVFACMLGITYENSNWRVEPYWENIKLAFEVIYTYLHGNWDEIPERIQKAMEAFYRAYPKRVNKP